MIAITPMPPTISAIDEMTTSARNIARLICSQIAQHRVLRDDVEVVRLVQLEPVADAHDLLDFGQRLTLRGVVARQDADDAAEGVGRRAVAAWRRC